MLTLKLGPDREPHCARPGCGERIGSIVVSAWEMAHDEFPASSWSEPPRWSDSDHRPTKYGGRTRVFVLGGEWRKPDGVWERPRGRRNRRPRVTSYGDVTSSEDFGEPMFDPFHAPALPAVVECPKCKAHLTADADALEVASWDEDALVNSGREPAPLGKVHPYMTKAMDDYIEDMAAEYYANRDDTNIDD